MALVSGRMGTTCKDPAVILNKKDTQSAGFHRICHF